MRLASLDLGTNALLLTIVDWDGESLTPVYEDATLIRLGQDLKKTGLLHPKAKFRCIKALKSQYRIMANHKVDKIIAVGTEALRRASDGTDFVERIETECGLFFRVIDNDEEARLTFKATQEEFDDTGQNLLMFDIGGGSTEVVTGTGQKITSIRCLEIGTVLLTERYVHHDPILVQEIKAADKVIRSSLEKCRVDPSYHVAVGIGGTVTTLKSVALRLEEYSHKIIHKSLLTQHDVDELLDLFLSVTLKERLTLKGLPEKRADIIPVGALITKDVMEVFNIAEIRVSDRGLRWGVLYDWIEQQTEE